MKNIFSPDMLLPNHITYIIDMYKDVATNKIEVNKTVKKMAISNKHKLELVNIVSVDNREFMNDVIRIYMKGGYLINVSSKSELASNDNVIKSLLNEMTAIDEFFVTCSLVINRDSTVTRHYELIFRNKSDMLMFIMSLPDYEEKVNGEQVIYHIDSR